MRRRRARRSRRRLLYASSERRARYAAGKYAADALLMRTYFLENACVYWLHGYLLQAYT